MWRLRLNIAELMIALLRSKPKISETQRNGGNGGSKEVKKKRRKDWSDPGTRKVVEPPTCQAQKFFYPRSSAQIRGKFFSSAASFPLCFNGIRFSVASSSPSSPPARLHSR